MLPIAPLTGTAHVNWCHMLNKYQHWLVNQDEAFRNEVGRDLKTYTKQPLTLKQLEELDNKFINQSPEGGDNNE